MSNDISKVYQFLSTIGDWKTNADKDGDGIIVKKEMRSFLQENYFENYSGWDGTAPTENQKNDIINQFFTGFRKAPTNTGIFANNQSDTFRFLFEFPVMICTTTGTILYIIH